MSEHEAIVESAEDGEAKHGLLEILRAQPLSDESMVRLVEAHPMVPFVNPFRADA